MVRRKSRSDRWDKQGKSRRRRQGGKGSGGTEKGHLPRIGPDTPHAICSERLTGFGGLLGLVKFADLIGFKDVFEECYVSPKRKPKLGCYRMVLGLLMLLFVGFQRIAHFEHIREDAMVCGILKVPISPAVSTFWRYLQSLRIMQSQSLLRVAAGLRERVWWLVGYQPERVSINIDTTTSTVYGKIQGAYKGYNPKHPGREGLRPVLCFIYETREYLCGTQRRGKRINGQEIARQILSFRSYLPDCVKSVLIRGDGEFIGRKGVQACRKRGYDFIFANRQCKPPFEEKKWFRHGDHEYNECVWHPEGWEEPCRFVAMRIHEPQEGQEQGVLFEEEEYVYRVFATTLTSPPPKAIAEYDKRADVENLIGESQREGIAAIPSRRFQSHHAYFQIVMLAYNLWRWMKQVAGYQQMQTRDEPRRTSEKGRIEIVDQTIRMARLKMLYVAAKVTFHANRNRVYYSIHENRATGITDFLDYLDLRRSEKTPWRQVLAPAPGVAVA